MLSIMCFSVPINGASKIQDSTKDTIIEKHTKNSIVPIKVIINNSSNNMLLFYKRQLNGESGAVAEAGRGDQDVAALGFGHLLGDVEP